jgi:hypothetical protein
MDAGDTFFFDFSPHLWVVVSDPRRDSSSVLVANLSEDRGKDPACILGRGDHPYLRKRTCIRYDKCRTWSNAELDEMLSAGRLRVQEPMSETVLEFEKVPRCRNIFH